MNLSAYVDGVGLLGPGISGWETGAAVLAGRAPYHPQKTVLPPPALLPPAERRRSCVIVKLSIAIGVEALAAAKCQAPDLPAVFASSGGEGENCHAICEALASGDRRISPTRFHNSVHNVSAGYWSIATGAMTPGTLICAYDGSFAAGLLEALTQCVVDETRVLLLAYDANYPEPLHSARPLADALGIALVLSPRRGEYSRASLTAAVCDDAATRFGDAALESLRAHVPAARGLPLLRAMARGIDERVVLDYLDDLRLGVAVAPC
jgi:hypothetical protein